MERTDAERAAFLRGEEGHEGCTAGGQARNVLVVLPPARIGARRKVVLGCVAIASLAALTLWAPWATAAPATNEATDGTAEQLFFKFRNILKPPRRSPTGYSQFLHQTGAEEMVAKALSYSESVYNESTAKAFAAMSKLAYCGDLPGLYSAVASTCSLAGLPGVTGACERSGFEVVPGLVRTLTAHGDAALFGYVARVKEAAGAEIADFAALAAGSAKLGPVADGLLVSIRGAINSMNSSLTSMNIASSLNVTGCQGCKVHQGYSDAYAQLKGALMSALKELQCNPGDCNVYITGHGAGAAISAIAAWELSEHNYTIGKSYIFGAPQVGNQEFAAHMNERFTGKQGPVFQVTQGKDSVARWPHEGDYTSWGVEAHYEDVSATKPQICWAGSKSCGVMKFTKIELNSQDHCESALAPGKNFCTFTYWSTQCYGGLGFEVAHNAMAGFKALPENMKAQLPQQPVGHMANTWHPSTRDGDLERAMKNCQNPKEFYNLNTLKAFAALAKITYCGPSSGVQNSVISTCKGGDGVCGKAGFGVVPNSVTEVSAPYNGSRSAFFFYSALIRRTSSAFAKAPYFMPSEACVLAFRGTANKANQRMNQRRRLVDLDEPLCQGCQLQRGVYEAWKDGLEDSVIGALKKSGCQPSKTTQSTRKVFLVGHSMGGTMMTMASYFLQRMGFKVQLSWILEGGRPGNPAFMDFIYQKLFSKMRPVAMWHATHVNDGVPRWPSSRVGYGHHQMQVHFNTSSVQLHTLCIGLAQNENDAHSDEGGCGNFQFTRPELAFNLPNSEHCSLPYAPNGEMCMLGYPYGPYKTDSQCYFGGSIESKGFWM